jgi:O-acetyl-ADP-ribose deacetylase (regulator of RNase III)
MREIAIGTSRLELRHGDITILGRYVGAIVNAANESLRPGAGVSAAIHKFGGPDIAVECLWTGKVETGQVVATTAGRLLADVVIHAVGPVWQGGGHDEDRLLAGAYRNSLELASQRGLSSIAFPSISTGVYGYPVDRAAAVAIGTVAAYLKRGGSVQEVILVQFSEPDHLIYLTALDRWMRLQAARAAQATQGKQPT